MGIELICVTVPLPSSKLSPNASRVHYREKASLIKKQREETRLVALEAAYKYDQKEPITSAIVQIIRFNRSIRRTDPDNLIAQLKSTFDGITDAGVWVDDLDVVYLPPIQKKSAANPRVELWIRQSPGDTREMRERYFPGLEIVLDMVQPKLELQNQKPF